MLGQANRFGRDGNIGDAQRVAGQLDIGLCFHNLSAARDGSDTNAVNAFIGGLPVIFRPVPNQSVFALREGLLVRQRLDGVAIGIQDAYSQGRIPIQAEADSQRFVQVIPVGAEGVGGKLQIGHFHQC